MSAPAGRPVFICGAPRSGTTLTAKALVACGVWAGHVTSLCEHVELKRDVLKPALRRGGMDEKAMRSFATVRRGTDPDEIRSTAAGILQTDRWQGGPWLFKDPKLVFCWELWAKAFPDALWITVWREPAAVADSFGRWVYTNQPWREHGAERVIWEHQSRAAQIPGVKVYPDRLLNGRPGRYELVCAALGLKWDPAAVAQVVDPKKYHRRGGS